MEPQYNDICARARVDEALTSFMGEIWNTGRNAEKNLGCVVRVEVFAHAKSVNFSSEELQSWKFFMGSSFNLLWSETKVREQFLIRS